MSAIPSALYSISKERQRDFSSGFFNSFLKKISPIHLNYNLARTLHVYDAFAINNS